MVHWTASTRLAGLLLAIILLAPGCRLLSSTTTPQLTFEPPAEDENLPLYIPRSYPAFPDLLDNPTAHHREPRHTYRHHHHRRHRRQFAFTAANLSLGHGADEGTGPWGPWSELSECSRNCGTGVQYQTRSCLERLTPQACIGPTKRYFSCSYEQCPPGSDFREDQCSRFNSIPFEGEYHEWIPYTKVPNPCELHCRPRGRQFYVRQSRKVIDGTRCHSADAEHICIEGVCVALGCDGTLGSGITEDRCRVCGGDGSTCRTVEGVYEQTSGMVSGYNDILLIPAGATNIRVEERKPTNNYLAIRSLAGTYYLNGDWHIAQPGSVEFAGTKWEYSKPGSRVRGQQPQLGPQTEVLRAKGPTKEALFVVLLYQEENQGISYEYSVPFSVHQPAALAGVSVGGLPLPPSYPQLLGQPELTKYSWIFGDFGPCSRNCGTGTQRRKVYCATVNSTTGAQEPVQEALCDGTVRPHDVRPCINDRPCPAVWYQGDWSACSCVFKVQTRSVFCTSGEVDQNSTQEGDCPILPDAECQKSAAGQKPTPMRSCVPERCPVWIEGEWSECDSTCGQGLHNRTVRCGFPAPKKKTSADVLQAPPEDDDLNSAVLMQRRQVTEEEATTLATPTTTEAGVLLLATESPTVDVIDGSKAAEEVVEPEDEYVDDWLCDLENRPKEIDACYRLPCDETGSVEWITSAWSNCDADCGSTISTRKVVCSTADGTVFDDAICVQLRGKKPADTQDCPEKVASCSRSLWFVGEWSECSVACGAGMKTRHVFCGHLDEATGKAIPDDDETKCTASPKPLDATVCKGPDCPGLWLSGPLGPCTVPCGGGNRKRPLFCMHECSKTGDLSAVGSELCSTEPTWSKTEQCNVESCEDADLIALLVACKDAENGCCPTDNTTPADVDYRNCPVLAGGNDTTVLAKDCKESAFGCCHSSEENIEAMGPFGLGCPIRCNNTKFGCCDDQVTVAEAKNKSGCPVEVLPATTTTTTEAPTTTEVPLAKLEANIVTVSTVNCTESDLEGSGDSECLQKQITSAPMDCKKSPFGCCADGWTDATGPNGEGCDEDGSGDGPSFVTTISTLLTGLYNTVAGGGTGSPLEVTTSKIWPQSEDCNLTEFGCCPNGKKAATGPRYYGCTCEDYPFGCCQDGFSPASGDNYAGCLCERMLYGCCPDGVTPATGANQEGCSCASSTYGCCSDMVTTARGPNFFGCPCDTLTFGCCPGSTIPAKGANFEGCTCADTPFGCCADGVTVAYGPKFEGCPSGPQLDLKLASEVCSLPMTVGGCRNFSVKWYFDVSYGSCNRFWYGGCEGNGNRFSSQELCERACVKPEGPERCALPKISGPCNASQIAWYYDGLTRRCDRFQYGGCLGNTNRFESQEQCEEHCVYQEKAMDRCDQPVSPGPCQGAYRRWYYRKEEGRCREFLYGGCQGNLNNFNSEAECSSACGQQSPFEICAAPKAEGPCLGNFPRWHFDQAAGVCREFTYSGCEGNKNRFVDRQSCERLCNQTITTYNTYEPSSPALPSEPDHINSVYGPGITRYEAVCALPKSVGPCRELVIQWWFNALTGRCERFYYGGCDGNANRFDDEESCLQRCQAPSTQRRPMHSDPCLEPKDSGQCQDYSERWYYDVEDRRCHRFYFSGCGGNHNNYPSLEECSARCERPRETIAASSTEATSIVDQQFQVEYCFKNFDSGPCQNNQIRWYYDRRDGGCKEFIYGGCKGNENRFESQLECETKCWNSQDICKLSPSRGSCSLNFTQWYFDYNTKECYEFQFSGCHGNANRFSSKEECDQQCRSVHRPPPSSYHPAPPVIRTVPEHCRLPRDPGPCQAYIRSWYFSLQDNQCRHFIYGGCQGNKNRYVSRDDCEAACTPRDEREDEGPGPGDSREVVCRLPAESGPCQETQAVWFYDPNSHTCLPFAYGGCRGNKNRFPTYEHCIGFCGGVQSRDLAPPRAPQPKVPPPYVPSYQQPQVPVQQPQPPPPPPLAEPEDCELVTCKEEQCPLGIDYFTDSRGCPSCRCTNPCYELHCPDDMSCALEMYRDETGKARGHAECRLVTKPGSCPSPEEVLAASSSGPYLNGTNCMMQCRTDADCRGADKCCQNGCAAVCYSIFGAPEMPPYVQPPRPQPTPQPRPTRPPPQQHHHRPEVEPESFPYDPNSRPDEDDPILDPYEPNAYDPHYDPNAIHVQPQPQQPQPSTGAVPSEHEPPTPEIAVIVDAGADAVLDCHVLEEGAGISAGTSVGWSRDGQQILGGGDKYELLVNGSLIVKRTNFGDHGTYACVAAAATETGYVRLLVKAPAQILPGPQNVIAQIGFSSYLQCNAIGYPDPRVTWWRGDRMLPLNSIKYLQMANYTLLIRKVAGKDSGVYTCNAFNGIGPAALWDVTLLLDSKPVAEPVMVEYNGTWRSAASSGGKPKPTSYLDRISAEISLTPPQYKIGSTLELRCLVRSQINGEVINPSLLSSVAWFINSEIPLTATANPRYRLLNGNSTLMVYHMMKQDSGEYRCRASTGPYADTMASVVIQVDNIFVPTDCQDNPAFTNCEMIVASSYCSNSFYNKFCCRSCYIADVKAGRIREAAAAA